MLWLLENLGLDVTGYDRWTLGLAGSAGSATFWSVTLLLLAALALGWFHLRTRQRSGRRRALWLLRLSALALVSAMFLQPELRLLKTVPIRTQVVVGVDRTPSMGIADAAGGATRIESVARALGQSVPWEALEREHELRYVLFGGRGEGYQRAETSRSALAQGYQVAGSETDLAAALGDLAKLSRERATAGVVLITDGADLGVLGELRDDPGALSEFLRRNDLLPAAPLTTVRAGGEEAFADLAIRSVEADEYGFIRNQVRVRVELAAQSVGAQQVPVSIKQGTDILASGTAALPAGGGTVSLELGFSPTRVGEFVYTVEVPVLAGEQLTENNRREFRMKVIRDKVRVLHVVGRPSWDERFLRRTLKEDPNIDLVSFMILRELRAIPFREEELSLIPFPTDEIFDKKLHTFDLVIFQNFQYMPRYGILPAHLANIRRFVKEEGGGFVMIGGEQSFASGRYAGTPIEDILPVSLRFTHSLLEEGKDIAPGRFVPQLPKASRLHPITRLHFDPQRSAELWRHLPPLDGLNRTGDLVAGGVALLQHPTLRTPSGRTAPVVAAADVGKGRSLAIATDSSWYWNFLPVDKGGTNEAYLSFWREAIRWLTRDPALKQLNITPDRLRYRPGEQARVEVSVLSPEYEPVDDAEVTLTFRSLDGTVLCQGPATALGEGRYESHCKVQGAGHIEVLAKASRKGASLGSESTYLEVMALSREFEEPRPDAGLLELLASLGGGESLSIDEGRLDGAPRLVSERAYRVLGSKELPLWDTPAALLLLVSLLGLEWWLRRRWGMA